MKEAAQDVFYFIYLQEREFNQRNLPRFVQILIKTDSSLELQYDVKVSKLFFQFVETGAGCVQYNPTGKCKGEHSGTHKKGGKRQINEKFMEYVSLQSLNTVILNILV